MTDQQEKHMPSSTEPPKRMPIAKVRSIIDSCNWSVNDLHGATRSEFARMDVQARLEPHIKAVEDAAQHIPDTIRFVPDVRRAFDAANRAKLCIDLWLQIAVPVLDPRILLAQRAELIRALHSIALGASNSMTSKEDLGRAARKAIAGVTEQ